MYARFSRGRIKSLYLYRTNTEKITCGRQCILCYMVLYHSHSVALLLQKAEAVHGNDAGCQNDPNLPVTYPRSFNGPACSHIILTHHPSVIHNIKSRSFKEKTGMYRGQVSTFDIPSNTLKPSPSKLPGIFAREGNCVS